MTEPATFPKVIVVAEQPVYDLLAASGAAWDVQHRIETVGQMWDDLSGGRLDAASTALIFSDQAPGNPGELEAAVAAMAPHAAVLVVTWDPAGFDGLLARIRESALQQGTDPDAPVYSVNPDTGLDLLDGVASVLGAVVGFPEHWPAGAEAPLGVYEDPETTWEPEPPAYEPPAAPVQPAPAVAAPAFPAPVPAPAFPAAPVPAPAFPAAPVPAPAAPSYPAPAPAVAAPAFPAPAPAYPATPGQVDPLGRPARPGQVTIAVTSSKGGSGKSTTALSLAAQIAQSSKAAGNPLRVVLVDMDTRDGQVASLIGRYVPTALNIRVSPQWDEETILQNLVHDPKLGIDALLAPVRPRTADDVGPDFYRHVIRMLKTTHDVVVMDTSVNYLDPLISTVCLPESSAILFVTTLATTSVQGMARALREITEPVENGGMGINRKKIGIVVNQSVTDVGMEKDQVLQAALKVPIVGAVPLATRDVLTATNYNRMHLLLKHPLLGPAYYRLATACLKNVPLAPLVEGDNGSGPTGPGAPRPVSPAPTPQAGPHPVPVATTQEDGKKRRWGRG